MMKILNEMQTKRRCLFQCLQGLMTSHTHTQSHTKTHRFVRGKGNVAVVAAKGNRQTKNYYYIQTIEQNFDYYLIYLLYGNIKTEQKVKTK